MFADDRQAWVGIVRSELRMDRARWVRMASMTGCATFLATVFLVFRVPLPAYGAYVVLMASQRDLISSITLSIGALAAATAGIAFSLLLYMVDVGEPALRVPAMAVVMFGAMYLSRTPKVGPIFFLGGFMLVVTQTLVDQIPNAEALTHLMLWLLLLVFCACTLVPLVELFVGRKPGLVFADGIRERAALVRPTISLRELATLASRLGPQALRRLAAAVQLEQVAAVRPSAGNDAVLDRAKQHFARQLDNPGDETGTPLPSSPVQRDHVAGVRFAFKATLAAMLCYVIYSGLDWSGIRTSIITCFFVALSSTGETIHKLGLRLSGALIGGVLAGVSIVFLFPVMDDIGGFVVLFASVTLLCTWVATSSPLLAYAGLQMAFAFYLGVLQDTGPTDDLTVLRDRLVGIVLGNLAMSLVFSTLWPVSTTAAAKAVLARIIGRQARLLEAAKTPAAADIVATAVDLEEGSRLSLLASFDVGETQSQEAAPRSVLAPLTQVVAWSNVCLAEPVADEGMRVSMLKELNTLDEETTHAR
jgi:multidrug resistance protein MdtO